MNSGVRISQESALSTSLPPISENEVRLALARRIQPISDDQLTAFREEREILQQELREGGSLSAKSMPKPLDQATLDAVTEGIG